MNETLVRKVASILNSLADLSKENRALVLKSVSDLVLISEKVKEEKKYVIKFTSFNVLAANGVYGHSVDTFRTVMACSEEDAVHAIKHGVLGKFQQLSFPTTDVRRLQRLAEEINNEFVFRVKKYTNPPFTHIAWVQEEET